MELIIDKTGYELRSESGRCLRLTEQGKLVQRIPFTMLESVVLESNALLEANLLRQLNDAGISLVLMPGRVGTTPVMLGAVNQHSGEIRRILHRCYNRDDCKMRIAQALVFKKRQAMSISLDMWLTLGFTDLIDDRTLPEMQQWQSRISQADTVESLRGIEGAMARYWFTLLRRVIPAGWEFTQRNRRPPADPVNALLSLTYTLACSQLERTLASRGLDTALGFLHEPVAGRPALALDLIEPFRPLLDQFVQLASEALTPEHFYQRDGACLLNTEGRKVFYPMWAQWKRELPLNPGDQRLFNFGECHALPSDAKTNESLSFGQACFRLTDQFAQWLGVLEAQAESP